MGKLTATSITSSATVVFPFSWGRLIWSEAFCSPSAQMSAPLCLHAAALLSTVLLSESPISWPLIGRLSLTLEGTIYTTSSMCLPWQQDILQSVPIRLVWLAAEGRQTNGWPLQIIAILAL